MQKSSHLAMPPVSFQLAHRWLLLAVISIAVSGVFAFFIAIARMPGISHIFSAPDFFRRALVVHVDLGVSVWLTAFPVALFSLLRPSTKSSLFQQFSLFLSFFGILLLALTGFTHEGEPFLSNYIPVISHPLFLIGLVVYFCGVGLSYCSSNLWGSRLDLNLIPMLENAVATSQMGIRLGALYLLASLATLLFSALNVPFGLDGKNRFEIVMWGGGHVLQFSNIAFMLVCWVLLLNSWMGFLPITRRQCYIVFSWLALPLFVIPFLATQDVSGVIHREGFSLMMRWGIFPPVLVFLYYVLPKVYSSKKALLDARFLGFALSVFMILNGFIYGALVRGPDLRLPGHYHSSIGAVTLSYMTSAYLLFAVFRKTSESFFLKKQILAQVILTGLGQILFSAGMFIAGSYGMARKIYGTEQQIGHIGQSIGMWIMGTGGALALLGGLIFVYNAFSSQNQAPSID